MIRNISDSIIYIGANDHEIDLFEGQYTVPNGMAYNSYAILDDRIAIMDTIDKKKTEEWLSNIEAALQGKKPDYLIVQHMEPDHSASIEAFTKKYPDAAIVGNARTFNMIAQFFPGLEIKSKITVADGESLSLGKHTLNFIFAPMVHWPEVMMTYVSEEKILFSADGFGKFGALDVEEDWACEARRYYFGIVGKFGRQVQAVLKKAANLEIKKICPLHGPVLEDELEYYIGLYDTWSAYRPEKEGVCICYTSVYGHTAEAAKLLAAEIEKRGIAVAVSDLARCDMAEAVEDAFKYDRLVLATTTYNGDMFPFMNIFIDELCERDYQNRRIAFIENGSWAPMAMKRMKDKLVCLKDIVYAENNVTIKSAMTEANVKQLEALAEELSRTVEIKKAEAPASSKKFVCSICGYVHEADSLAEDFTCPMCKKGKEFFKEIAPAPLKKFVCSICGYTHEAEALAEDFTCPMCKKGKEFFKEIAPAPLKKFVCSVCGYTHEAEALPDDFTCPLCKKGREFFKEEA